MYNNIMQIKYLETIIDSGLFQYVRKSDYIDACEQLNITSRSCRKGDIIFYQGDVIDAICIVESGSVRGEKTYPNGDIHIVSLFDEGSIFALEIAVSRKKTSPVDLIANENAVPFYEKLGMKPADDVMQYNHIEWTEWTVT